MDQHQLIQSSHDARTQNFYQLCKICQFIYKIPSNTHTYTHVKILEAKDEIKLSPVIPQKL